MLTRIAIVSAPSSDLEVLRSVLRKPMKFTVREFLSMEAVIHGLVSFPMEVLILRLPVFDDRHVEMARRVRRRFHQSGVIISAKEIRPSARMKATNLENFKLIQESHEVTDLPALIERFQQGGTSAHRQHPRARRGDPVQVVDPRGMIHRGHFLDFAQMGARLSIPSLHKFEPRDSVQIIYGSSADPLKQHRIEAKIVWSAFDGGIVDQFRGVKQQTAGLRFVASY